MAKLTAEELKKTKRWQLLEACSRMDKLDWLYERFAVYAIGKPMSEREALAEKLLAELEASKKI